MKLKKLVLGSMLVVCMGVSGIATAADMVIGVPNWPSVKATGDILKFVIEDNFGVEVELQSGTNPIIFEAMDTGSMDVHPEVWMPNQQNLYDTYVVDKGSVVSNPNGVPAFQGMCVTQDSKDRTGIENLTDLTDPAMAELFDSDGDGRGNIWIGATGWASTNVEYIRAKSYGYDQTMNLDVMDETLALAQVDAAVAKGENIVFFCYTPHHMFSLHDLVPLKEPKHVPEQWIVYQPTDDPDWLEKSSAPIAWTVARLHVMYAKTLEERFPEVARLLSRVKLNTELVSQLTYAVVIEKRDMAEYAAEWVAANSELVESWLSQ